MLGFVPAICYNVIIKVFHNLWMTCLNFFFFILFIFILNHSAAKIVPPANLLSANVSVDLFQHLYNYANQVCSDVRGNKVSPSEQGGGRA